MKLTAALTIVTLIYYIYLFTLSVKNYKRSLSHRLLVFSLLCLIYWSALSYFTYTAENLRQISVIAPISMIGMFPYFPLNNLFIISLIPGKKINPVYAAIICAPAVFLSVINFWIPVSIKEFILHPNGWEFIPPFGHPLNMFWILYSCMTFIINIIILFKLVKNEKLKRRRKQNVTLLITSISSILLVFLDYVLHPALRNIRPAPISPILMAIWISGMYYAVKRQRFLDIFPEDMARDILHSLDEHIILSGFDGTVLYLNKTAEKLLKKTYKGLLGSNIEQFVFIEGAGSLKEELKRIGASPKSYKALFGDKDGGRTPDAFDLTMSMVKDKYGRPAGIALRGKPCLNYLTLKDNYGLTDRELEVIYLAANNLKNKTIGKRLNITERTVKAHLTNIYAKLGIKGKLELAGMLGKLERPAN